MDNSQILTQGLVLLAAGVVIVFGFLYTLILMMRLTASIVPRFNHLLPDAAPKKPAARPAAVSDETAVAIAVAVAAARQSQG